MRSSFVLVVMIVLNSPTAWGVTDPVGDSIANSIGFTADLISGSVEAGSGWLHFDLEFEGDPSSFQASLDTDQDASTGFPGAWGYPGNSVNDGSLGTEYVVDWDTATSTLSVKQWDGNTFFTAYTNPAVDEPLFGEGVSVPLALLGEDDGLMNYKIISKESGGGSNEGVLLDVMPDAGLLAATSTIVPEPHVTSLLLLGAICFGLQRRNRIPRSRP